MGELARKAVANGVRCGRSLYTTSLLFNETRSIMMSSFLRATVAVALLAIVATPAMAATITWGSPTAVSTSAGNSSDVSTNGTLVEAYNAVDSDDPLTDVTVNGVLFTATNALLTGNYGGTNDFSNGTDGGDAAYDALLSTLDYGSGGGLVTRTLGEGDGNGTDDGGGNLVVGQPYEIQLWFVDDRGAYDTRVMQFGDGNGNTVNLNDQYVIGTFTADTTTQQVITLDAQGFGNAHWNAYQIRSLSGAPPIPEPMTMLAVGLSIAGLGGYVRKRNGPSGRRRG